MYLVPIAWLYVAVMMSVAEATNTNGTVLGAILTFLLYGALPVGLVLYFMGSPSRRRANKAREAAEAKDAAERASAQPDAGSLPPTDPVTPVRKEP
jgi:hypothetical protein